MTLSSGCLRFLQRKRTTARVLCFTLLGVCACQKSVEPSPQLSSEPTIAISYLTPRYLDEAIDKLIEPLPRPTRLLSLTALNRVVAIHVQDSKDPLTVLEYRYSNGQVTGPVPVELNGPGKLSDNLFRVDSVDPHVAAKVLTQMRSEYSEEIRKLVLTRNLPTSMDIQFRVFLKTDAGDRIIVADKGGRLLGPLTPTASPTNSSLSP
jgi:hypothetical protein